MKKQLLNLLILVTFIGFISMGSCTKIEDSKSSTSINTALISGDVRANLDLSNDTNEFGFPEIKWERVPAGTQIFARINSVDLDPNPSVNLDYRDITFNTFIGSDGKYAIEVYAGPSNTAVTLIGDEFKFEQKVNDSTYEWKIFSMQNITLTVINDLIRIEDLTFFPEN